jgi:hypothetical protein
MDRFRSIPMLLRTTVLGTLGFAVALSLVDHPASAAVLTLTQEQGLSSSSKGAVIPATNSIVADRVPTTTTTFTPTDWGPANSSPNPLTFSQFSPGRTIGDAMIDGTPQSVTIPTDAKLQSVNLTFNWGFSNQITLSFQTNGTETEAVSGGITLSKPNADIQGANPNPNNFLFPTQTFSTSYTVPNGVAGHSYSPSSTPGSPNTPGPPAMFISGQNGYAAPLSVSYNALTDPTDVKAFVGNGTIDFQAIATATSHFFSSSGNGSGSALTSAHPDLTITYIYTSNSIPEPSSFWLLGLGGGLYLVLCHRRRKHSA